MADNKNQAMDQAKDAALSSVGFMLPVTKAQSIQIRKSSLVAAREVVSVRKNIVKLVEKFKVYENAVNQIKAVLRKGGDTSAQVAKITGIISAGGNAYKEKEAEIENKPKALELVQGAADNIAKAVPGAAMLALAIPFLLSPEVRAMIGSFFDGLLEQLGLSKGVIEKVKIGLGITAGILGAYFSMKVLGSVFEAFNQMQKLAEVMGIAGSKVATEKDKIDDEKKKVAAAGDKAKGEVKDTKKDIKKGKKLGKLNFVGKFKLLMEKIGPKLKSLVGNFLKAIPGVGTILGIGFILYELFDIGKDIFDMFTGSADDKEEAEQEETAPLAASAEPQTPPTTFAEPESKPAASMMSAEMGPEVTEPVAMERQAEATPTPSMDGSLVREVSMAVEQADVDLNQMAGGINITTIDNSTTVVDVEDKPVMNYTPMYSVTVGA